MILDKKKEIIKTKKSQLIISGNNDILCYSGNHNFSVLSGGELNLYVFLEEGDNEINIDVMGGGKAYIKVLASPEISGKTKAKIVGKISGESAYVDIYIAGLAFEKSSLDIDGNIIISKEASSGIAHLKQENIILGEKTTIKGVPNLFAYNNDIEASHSCSISTIKDEDIFYLSSRGISLDKAKEMMIFSYIDKVFGGFYNKNKLYSPSFEDFEYTDEYEKNRIYDEYETAILEIKEKIIS